MTKYETLFWELYDLFTELDWQTVEWLTCQVLLDMNTDLI